MKRKRLMVFGIAVLMVFTMISFTSIGVAETKYCFEVINCTGNDSCSGSVISTSGCTITCKAAGEEVTKKCPKLNGVPSDDIDPDGSEPKGTETGGK